MTKIQNFIFGNSVLLLPKHTLYLRYKIFSSNIFCIVGGFWWSVI